MGSSVAEALGGALDALGAAGVADPRLDAELLLASALGLPRAELTLHRERRLSGPEARLFATSVRRRTAREPVAYILGGRGFRNLWLEVDRRVLIPRPETELLVEIALERRPASVLDVGTGSGAIALAVADELPGCRVSAFDVSEAALDVARSNAARLGLSGRVEIAAAPPVGESFDLVLANLPYVSAEEWDRLEPEITEYEPRGALVGGENGVEPLEALLGELAIGTFRAAAIALELGAGQAGMIAELVRRAGFERVDTRRDLAGIDRVVLGVMR